MSVELIPKWMNFLIGVMDSEDLPLNISREALRPNRIIRVIQEILVKTSLEMFTELTKSKDDSQLFYELFGKGLKLGVVADSTYMDKIAERLLFHTSQSENERISLKEFVDQKGRKTYTTRTGRDMSSLSLRKHFARRGRSW